MIQIGFSQPIELAWMEAAANAVSAGLTPQQVRESLHELLADRIAVKSVAHGSSRVKRVAILMTIWVEPRTENLSFRDFALTLWRSATGAQRVLIHYAMTIVAYPFFLAVSTHIGRLLRLQEHFSVEQLKRRCQEEFGQRDTVAFALTRVLRTLADWGLLIRAGKVGIYAAPMATQDNPRLFEHLLIEACLRAGNERDCLIDNITANPGLFPWKFRHSSLPEITASTRLSIRSSDFGGVRVALSGD